MLILTLRTLLSAIAACISGLMACISGVGLLVLALLGQAPPPVQRRRSSTSQRKRTGPRHQKAGTRQRARP